MFWLSMATGFTGALTLVYLARLAHRFIHAPAVITANFSPKGGCTDTVVHHLQAARHEVLVLAYSFTSRPIAQALVDAKLRGVHVEVVLDHSNEKDAYSDLHFFLEQGLTPVIDPHHAIAHNKVMIIDNHTLVTGSFNFTSHAENENAENLLVIKGHPELVHAYREDFQHHKGHSRAPQTSAKPEAAAAASTLGGRHAAAA